MARRDRPHRPRARAGDQRLGGRLPAAVPNALQEVAVGDAGGGEEHVLAGDEPVDVEDFIEVVAGVDRGLALGVVARPEPAEQLPAEALDRRRREHALRRPADPPEQVDSGLRGNGEQRRGDVAVADQPDPGSDLADLGDRGLVAGAVEHDHRHVADRLLLSLRDPADDLRERVVEAEAVRDLAAPGDLLHIDARARVEHRPALRERDHRERRGHPARGQRRSLERVDGDVDLGRAAVADPLAVVEHRGLVLLALADHDRAVHRHRVEQQPHRVDRGTVGGLLLAASDPARRGERRRLRDPNQLEREVAIRLRARPLIVREDRQTVPGALRVFRGALSTDRV